MKAKSRVIILLSLFLICLMVNLFSRDALRVEMIYSRLIYPYFSDLLRTYFGFISISIGDLIYGFVFCFLLFKFLKWIISFLKFNQNKKTIQERVYQLLRIIMVLYFVFNVCWGINYNRKGIAFQTQISIKDYNANDLKKINELLVEKVNQTKIKSSGLNHDSISNDELFHQAIASYDKASDSFSFLKYSHPSVKSSMWGWLGNYLGYTGYYNPFTGEAQVNTTIPKTTQPFIVCHEIAHQLGYAKESEANFVAYLVCRQSNNETFKYATYLDLFFYANRNLYAFDSTSAKRYRNQLNDFVKKDIKEIITFNMAHKSKAEPIITWLYDLFLKGNQQPQGMLSYEQVTSYLINYYRKFGMI